MSDTSKLSKKDRQEYFMEVLALAAILAKRAGRPIPNDLPFEVPRDDFLMPLEIGSPKKSDVDIDFRELSKEKLFEVIYSHPRLL